MEEKINQGLDDLYRINWVVAFLVFFNIGYYVYSAFPDHWNGWGGITAVGLDRAGALRADLVDQGEFWRLFASLFLHSGLIHLTLNMLNLYALGVLVQRLYGSIQLLFVYLTSGLLGSVFTWAMGTERTVGASGAIFGLLGLLWLLGWKHQKELQGEGGQLFRKQLAIWTLLSLGVGFLLPFIDNSAHLGGLTMGILLSMVLEPQKSKF